MKRSNITLLVLVGLAVTFIAAIPVLYQGKIADANQSMQRAKYSRHSFANAKVVKLVNMQNVTVKTADTLAIDFKEKEKGTSEFTLTSDTLMINGDGRLIVSVATQPVVVIGSKVLLKGDLRRLDAPSMSLILTNSYLYSQPISRDRRASQCINDFRITDRDGNSTVELGGRFDIDHLFLNNVTRFSCSTEVGLRQTDFSFDDNVKTMTCREGLFISPR